MTTASVWFFKDEPATMLRLTGPTHGAASLVVPALDLSRYWHGGSGSEALVPMMQPADLGEGDDLPTIGWLDGPPVRRVLVQR